MMAFRIGMARLKRATSGGGSTLDGDNPADPAGLADFRRDADATRNSLRVPKTAEMVAAHIRRRIIRGELNEGDFLPPEAQVTAALGISRPTLREAFRILEAENLISVMRGSRSGARVHKPRVEGASRYAGFVLQAEGTTVADIYEARLAIEPFIARRLAETRPANATNQLRAETERLRRMIEAGRFVDFMVGIAEFHRLLVEISGQHTLLFLTRLLQEILARYQVQYFKMHRLQEDEQRRRALVGIRSFDKLIELIEAGQGEAAEAHWRLHLVNANAMWVPRGHETKVVDVFD
jgi:DNA-binding FadR family transcriptional regulator